MSSETTNNGTQFASRWGFILASIGSAVGMANVWGFPAKVGQNGGGAFIIIYLLFIVLFGVVALSAEFAIGRRTGSGTVASYGAAWASRNEKLRTPGTILGWLPLAGSMGIALGYACIIAYILKGLVDSVTGTLLKVDAGAWFDGMAMTPFSVVPYHVIVVVVTLATMLMGRGLCYVILQAQTKGPLPASYNWIGTGFLPTMRIGEGTMNGGKGIDALCLIVAAMLAVLLVLNEIKSIAAAKKNNLPVAPIWQTLLKNVVIIGVILFFFYKLACYNGIPVVLILMALIVAIYHFITTKTVAGRQIYAMGGNAKAARLSGIDTKKVFFWVYTNMGFLAAVAGIVLSARNQSATPKAGDGFEMDAIASCYIGGAATSGGSGTIVGAVIGAFIMGILNNGMSLAGYDTNVQKVVKGLVLLGAVTFDLVSKRKIE